VVKKFARILAAALAFFALAGYGVFQLPAFGGRSAGERLERMHHSPEFIEGRFQNTPPQKTDGAFWETVRLYRQGQIREPQFEIPVTATSLRRCHSARNACIRRRSSWRTCRASTSC
jgi:hypothetical protein